eukprot:10665137-Prorocentrum_lima.AAC.1
MVSGSGGCSFGCSAGWRSLLPLSSSRQSCSGPPGSLQSHVGLSLPSGVCRSGLGLGCIARVS